MSRGGVPYTVARSAAESARPVAGPGAGGGGRGSAAAAVIAISSNTQAARCAGHGEEPHSPIAAGGGGE